MAVVITMNATPTTSVGGGPNPSQMRWETLRPIIQYLYQRMPLTSLMSVMEQDYSLKASRDEYKTQLIRWGLSNKVKSRKGPHSQNSSWPRTSARNTALPQEQVRELLSNKAKKTTQIPIRERNGRRKFHASMGEVPDSPGFQPHDQMQLPPLPQPRVVTKTPQLLEDDDSGSEDEETPSPTLSPHRLLELHNSSRWSILHQALLLGVIRGKMLPYLYPTKAAMFTDQFIGSTLSFSLMKIFEALTFIEQQHCGLEELLLTAYLITNNAMTPPTSTADATWAKVGFLAFGKACSVLTDFEPTEFRNKQAADFACTLESEHFNNDAWSRKYVSLLTEEDLGRYDVNEWESVMYQVIENLMRFASCSPDWRSIKLQTQLQMQQKKAQSVILNSVET